MQFTNSQRSYGCAVSDLIEAKEECPVSQDIFSEHPLGVYCLYGVDSYGIVKSQYFDTDYIYSWFKKCKEKGKQPTNPLTRNLIEDNILTRLEKYYLLKKKCPSLLRTEQKKYYDNFLNDIKEDNENIFENVIYKSIISAEAFKIHFMELCKPDNIKKIVEDEGYREAAYKLLENSPDNTWLIRPSSLIGNDNIVPFIITIKYDTGFENFPVVQKRGVGIVNLKNPTYLNRGDNIVNWEFEIVSDLFLEFLDKCEKINLPNYLPVI